MIDFLKVPLKRKESKIRKLKKEEYSYFKNKSCDICKKPAKAYLLIKGQHFLKCDSKKCNLVIEVKTGSFKFSGQVLI